MPIERQLTKEEVATYDTVRYVFYEPTIKGETVVKDGKLVSLESTDASLPKLGSVPSISDTLDLASGALVKNTLAKKLVADDGWIPSSTGLPNTKRFRFPVPTFSSDEGICNMFKWNTGSITTDDTEWISISGGNLFLNVLNAKTPNGLVSELQSYLRTANVSYAAKLATPTTTQLTPTQVDTYSQHKKVILLPFKEDKVVLNEDGSSTWVGASFRQQLSRVRRILSTGAVNVGVELDALNGVDNNNIQGVYCDKLGSYSYAELCRLAGNKNPWQQDTATTPITGISCSSSGYLIGIFEVSKFGSTLESITAKLAELEDITCITSKLPVITSIPKSLTPIIPINKINTLYIEE